MHLMPAETGEVNGRRVEEQRVSLRSLNRTTTVKLFSTGIFKYVQEADKFTMLITDYAGKKFYELIFTPSLQWRVLEQDVAPGRGILGDGHEAHVAFKLYKDGSNSDL